MANLAYVRYSDNRAVRLASGAAPTVAVDTGALDAGFPLANLTDENPAKVIKVATAPCGVTWDFGSATSIECAALIHHNFDVGLSVRLQANSAASWGAPPLEQVFTFAAADGFGYRPNAWLNVSGIAHSYRYWRLQIPTGNTATPFIGDIVLGATIRTLECNIEYPFAAGRLYPGGVRHRTAGGTLIDTTRGGSRMRTLIARMRTTDAGRVSMETLIDDVRGGSRPFLINVDGSAGADPWLVKFLPFPAAFDVTEAFLGNNEIGFEVVELSRGITVP